MRTDEAAEGIQGLDDANAELDRLIAEDAKAAGTTTTAATTDPSAETTEAQRAATTAEAGDQTDEQAKPAPKAADAAGGKSKEVTEAEKGKEAEAGKSRYAKAQERLGGTWAEVNAAKLALKAEQDATKTARETFEREKLEFASKRTEAEAEFTPDQYDAAARKFEHEGKFELAELAKGKADELRKNPDAGRRPDATAIAETQRKEWALKAGTDFPDLAKTNSPVQQRVAQLFQEEPELKTHPKGIYLAARIASLEAQGTQAAALKVTVATRDTELVKANARIKELEALTAPGNDNGVTRLPSGREFSQMNPAEQLADLQRAAEEVGSIR